MSKLAAYISLEDDDTIPDADSGFQEDLQFESNYNELNSDAITTESYIVALEELSEVANEVDEVQDIVSDNVGDDVEGLDQYAAEMMHININAICKRLGVSPNNNIPSLESFGSKYSRKKATSIALEGISDFFSSIWTAIKNFFKRIWDFIVSMYTKVKEFFFGAEKKAEKAADKLKNMSGDKVKVGVILNTTSRWWGVVTKFFEKDAKKAATTELTDVTNVIFTELKAWEQVLGEVKERIGNVVGEIKKFTNSNSAGALNPKKEEPPADSKKEEPPADSKKEEPKDALGVSLPIHTEYNAPIDIDRHIRAKVIKLMQPDKLGIPMSITLTTPAVPATADTIGTPERSEVVVIYRQKLYDTLIDVKNKLLSKNSVFTKFIDINQKIMKEILKKIDEVSKITAILDKKDLDADITYKKNNKYKHELKYNMNIIKYYGQVIIKIQNYFTTVVTKHTKNVIEAADKAEPATE